jgi:uncharacterized protein YebE (UPF0316 family)
VILLPLLIFLAETSVVTLDTVRTIFIARGMKAQAALLGLLEVTIWLFAISQVMQNLNNPACFLGYAAGFTVGTYLGIRIEALLALGTQIIRVLTRRDAGELVTALREAGHGVTSVEGQGATGGVHVLFTIVARKQLPAVVEMIEQFDPATLYVVEDVRAAAKTGLWHSWGPGARSRRGSVQSPATRSAGGQQGGVKSANQAA